MILILCGDNSKINIMTQKLKLLSNNLKIRFSIINGLFFSLAKQNVVADSNNRGLFNIFFCL